MKVRGKDCERVKMEKGRKDLWFRGHSYRVWGYVLIYTLDLSIVWFMMLGLGRI